MKLSPSPGVAGIKPYSVPKHGAPTDLKLDANEGAAPSSELLERAFSAGPDLMRLYPDASVVQRILAQRLNVEPERLLVTAGGDDALDRICRAVLQPGRELLTTDPSFEMLPRYARIMGASVKEVPWPEGPFPTDAVIAEIKENTAMIAFVSPNNPTGSVGTAADLRRLSAAAPDAVLLVDLAYIEFADEDLTEAALALPNTVIVRTLSKAWGLAGLRVGYAIGRPEIIQWMRASGGPYAVARPSIALAAARLLEDKGEMHRFVEQVREDREQIAAALRENGAYVTDSQGNFVFTRTPKALWIRDALAGLGIAVRAYVGDPKLSDALRITCPGEGWDCERLTHAIRSALAPEAIIFDLDGVLADVSRSYRESIIRTAEFFGVTLTMEDIVAEKARGNANNDWELTHRLMKSKGVDQPYETVVDRFEQIYQGSEEEPGLRATESMLCELDVLSRVAERYPMAIVTGRPRSDAARFLCEKLINAHFPHVVCMEDAPAKPSPEPVMAALRKLGVRRAWMIGDTPDDIVAARAAGVVPIGVVAPGERYEQSASVLTKAGAARVLSNVRELLELLP